MSDQRRGGESLCWQGDSGCGRHFHRVQQRHRAETTGLTRRIAGGTLGPVWLAVSSVGITVIGMMTDLGMSVSIAMGGERRSITAMRGNAGIRMHGYGKTERRQDDERQHQHGRQPSPLPNANAQATEKQTAHRSDTETLPSSNSAATRPHPSLTPTGSRPDATDIETWAPDGKRTDRTFSPGSTPSVNKPRPA